MADKKLDWKVLLRQKLDNMPEAPRYNMPDKGLLAIDLTAGQVAAFLEELKVLTEADEPRTMEEFRLIPDEEFWFKERIDIPPGTTIH